MEGTEVAVEEVRRVGEGTVAIDLSNPEGWEVLPGQFIQVGTTVGDDFVVRHYSVSSPYSDGSFEITVGVDPEGDLTPVLAELEPGDYLSADGPYGRSYYEGEERVVVVAGGPGVGPAVGIGERVADEHGAEGVTVVYTSDAPAHTERLNALRDEGAEVRVVADNLGGAVAEALDEEPGAQIFVYGFEGFIEEASEVLERTGYDADDAKVENFGPEPGSG